MGPAEYHYLSDPLPADSNLTAEQASHIVGGEVCAWGEFLSPENIDSRIWPRTAAIAERFWSPREVTNMADMYRRLDAVSVWLEQDGTLQLSSTDKMLRQVSGTADLGPLGVLGKITSPEGVGVREEMNRDGTPSTQLMPLVHLTDAVVPDPPYRRQFAALVDQLLGDAPKFAASSEELTRTFQQWRDMGPGFAAMAATAPVLQRRQQPCVAIAEAGQRRTGSAEVSAVGHDSAGGLERDATGADQAGRDTGCVAAEAAVDGVVSRADSGGCGGGGVERQQPARVEAEDCGRSCAAGAGAEVHVVGKSQRESAISEARRELRQILASPCA